MFISLVEARQLSLLAADKANKQEWDKKTFNIVVEQPLNVVSAKAILST